MLVFLDVLGVIVFSASGALVAGRKRLDAFGVAVVAFVSALGGGTLRDLILGLRPVFWVSQPLYVWVVLGSSGATFVLMRSVRFPARALLVLDAIGLATFTVLGCQRALEVTPSPLIVVLMGAMSGAAGGLGRDLLCGEIPLVLRAEIYATASLGGGAAFLALDRFGLGSGLSSLGGALVVLLIRLVSLRRRAALPQARLAEEHSSEGK